MLILFVASPSLIVLKIVIPPPTEASNSRFTLFFTAKFERLSPCFAIKALFGVITCILLLIAFSTIFFEIPSDNPMHSNIISTLLSEIIFKGSE